MVEVAEKKVKGVGGGRRGSGIWRVGDWVGGGEEKPCPPFLANVKLRILERGFKHKVVVSPDFEDGDILEFLFINFDLLDIRILYQFQKIVSISFLSSSQHNSRF